jgi:hypothetical protein
MYLHAVSNPLREDHARDLTSTFYAWGDPRHELAAAMTFDS